MSLKKKYKTNTAAANTGVWFDFPNDPNDDGTVSGFKLARKNSQNKAYAKAMREFTKEHTTDEGITDFDDLSEADAEAVELDVFTSALLIDWRNFQPDNDGKVIEFTLDNVKQIFGDPDWTDLYKDLVRKSGRASEYKNKQLKVEAKNS
jgi:hypothetical protein